MSINSISSITRPKEVRSKQPTDQALLPRDLGQAQAGSYDILNNVAAQNQHRTCIWPILKKNLSCIVVIKNVFKMTMMQDFILAGVIVDGVIDFGHTCSRVEKYL